MKIGMISGLANFSGGLENVVNELTNFLAYKKENVTIFGRDNRDYEQITPFGKTVGIRPYVILPKILRFPMYRKYVYSLKVWRKINRYGPFDIIHGHGDNCFFPSLFRSEKPFLMTFHGTLSRSFSINKLRSIPIVFTEITAARRCDLMVAVSNKVRNELITFYGVNPNRIKVIYNGVNIDKFVVIDKHRARQQLGLPLNRRYALWVGRDPLRKGLSTARKVIDGIPDFHLLVVGIEGESSGNTVFLGSLSENQLIYAYNAADFLLFPTMYEGFPVAPMEAMSCGLPIIVSKESNMGEIIKDGVHGFVINERNPNLYIDKINRSNKDATLKQMGIECRRLAENYSWKKQSNKYYRLYNRLLESY